MNLNLSLHIYEPGPELDALVAERMGWTALEWCEPFQSYRGAVPGDPTWIITVPQFSRYIAAAWQVVEYLTRSGITLKIEAYESFYTASLIGSDTTIERESAPHAICMAALVALSEVAL